MTSIRSCRACGCVDARARPGGCGWIAADRCLACPDAPLTRPINAAHLAAATLVQKIAYSWRTVDGEPMRRLMHQALEFPNLIIMTTTRAGVVIRREVYVGALTVSADDMDLAAELLNERRLAA